MAVRSSKTKTRGIRILYMGGTIAREWTDDLCPDPRPLPYIIEDTEVKGNTMKSFSDNNEHRALSGGTR